MEKAPDAFRTISEVADVLDTPAHVLRFWETKFPQIRPVKRAGGRRYYRPGDVALLAGIRHLLHDQGLTIRGVQKVLRESGVRHVQAMARGKIESMAEIGEALEIEAVLKLSFLSDVEPEAISAQDGADIVPLPQRKAGSKTAGRLREPAPPPANAPFFAEEVPEAPFIEAEEAEPARAEVLHLTGSTGARRRGRPPEPPAEELPLLARMANWDAADEALQAADAAAESAAELAADLDADTFGVQVPAEDDMAAEDLADLAAMDGVLLDHLDDLDAAEAQASRDPADSSGAAPEPSALEPPKTVPAPPQSLAQRLRALPRPLSPDTEAALASLLARALDLQARRAAAAPGRD